ncbi:hypothetical protein BGX26_000987 [Mortierella sp. AD094]|nr:hypothetical protein BGX26_000987 [Mortierella sp. AD094]
MSPKYDYLYSPNVVLPALQNGLRIPYTLFYSNTVLQNRKKYNNWRRDITYEYLTEPGQVKHRLKDDPVADCIKAAKSADVKVIKISKHELNAMSNQRPHQGVVLEASKLTETFVTALGPVSVDNQYEMICKAGDTRPFKSRDNEPPVWIALDEVVDPQNLGAIMRTALFMGVDGVVVCHKNSAPLSAVVAKASAGALEARPTYGDSQENGWNVVGAHVTYGSKRNRPIHDWPVTGVDRPTLLIMGSEGFGLRKQIMNQCDTFIQIPCLSTSVSNVDSLNVSVATGVILSKLMGGRFLHLPKNLKKFPLRIGRTAGSDKNDDDDGVDDDSKENGSDDDDDEDDDDDDDDDADDDNDDDDDGKDGASKNPSEAKPLPF